MSGQKRVSRVDAIFRKLRAEGRPALMPYVTAGHPSLDATAAVLPALQEAGASIVELGIPFSDPIADGPVIAGAMHEALISGTTPEKVFDLVRRVRGSLELGLVAMVSYSIVHRMGPEKFVHQAAESGFDGLIVPDLDVTDAARLRGLTDSAGLSCSLLIAPTTDDGRIPDLARACTGFVYLIARVGITGETDEAPDLTGRIAAIRSVTDLPIAVGFGISRSDHVASVTGAADAAIVGSALVRRMSEADDPVAAAASFVSDLAGGLVARR